MGYFIAGHFTKVEPVVPSVRAVLPPSIGFRVYRHRTQPLFGIDTFRANKPRRSAFAAATPATDLSLDLSGYAALQSIFQQLQQQNEANGLKRAYINLSASLSQALQQGVLSIYADDDGNDFACFSEQGKLVSLVARCQDHLVLMSPDVGTQLVRRATTPFHACAAAHLQATFGVAGADLGLGTFDPPDNYGFVEVEMTT